MNEWGVVGVLVVLIGLITAVVKPLLSLNTSITVLSENVKSLDKNVSKLTEENDKEHDGIWTHEGEQDEKLYDHETRITVLEHKGA